MGGKLWTYTLSSRDGRHTLNMPEGAYVIGLRESGGDPTLIAFVNPNNPVEPRDFYVVTVGSGDMPEVVTLEHISSFQSPDGNLKMAFIVRDDL
jgi:hypothetical protein